jgi:hypothetical protein
MAKKKKRSKKIKRKNKEWGEKIFRGRRKIECFVPRETFCTKRDSYEEKKECIKKKEKKHSHYSL